MKNLKTSAELLDWGGSPCCSCHTVLLLFNWLFRHLAGPQPIEPQEGGERQEKNGGKSWRSPSPPLWAVVTPFEIR